MQAIDGMSGRGRNVLQAGWVDNILHIIMPMAMCGKCGLCRMSRECRLYGLSRLCGCVVAVEWNDTKEVSSMGGKEGV